MLATERLYREVPAWTDQLAALLDGADPRTPVPTTPDWTLTDIHWGMVEFMGLQLIGLLLVMLFPGIALWFPHWLYGK